MAVFAVKLAPNHSGSDSILADWLCNSPYIEGFEKYSILQYKLYLVRVNTQCELTKTIRYIHPTYPFPFHSHTTMQASYSIRLNWPLPCPLHPSSPSFNTIPRRPSTSRSQCTPYKPHGEPGSFGSLYMGNSTHQHACWSEKLTHSRCPLGLHAG